MIIILLIMIIIIIMYKVIVSRYCLMTAPGINDRSPSSLRQQSTATVDVSVMQCLITLFNHTEISLIRSEDFVVSVEVVECCYGSPVEY